MTTIIGTYHNSQARIYADTQLTCANTNVVLGRISKLIILDAYALAVAGSAGIITAYRHIANQYDIESPKCESDVFELVSTLHHSAINDYDIVEPIGSDGLNNLKCQIIVASPYGMWCVLNTREIISGIEFVIGSGRAFALGALRAGATPGEAISIAASYDIYTGKDYEVWSSEDANRP